MDARPFALLGTADQWARARHEGTALDLPDGGVVLAWDEPASGDAGDPAPPLGAGLGFDSSCRLLRTLPDVGRVERWRWDGGLTGPPDDLAVAVPQLPLGDFAAAEAPGGGPLPTPRGLVVDDDDRLWIAESGAGQVVAWDLWTRRLLRRVPVPGAPIDLARRGRGVLALLGEDGGVAEIEDRAVRRMLALPAHGLAGSATRLAVSPDGRSLLLLVRGAERASWLVPLTLDAELRIADEVIEIDGASDAEWLDDATFVVARAPGEAFVRFVRAAGGLVRVAGLTARGYDGLGIARAPDAATVAYGTAGGPRLAVRARLRYARSGAVMTYRLDAGAPAVTWGRLFCDACVPEGCTVLASFVTSEEPSGPGELERLAPTNAEDLDLPPVDGLPTLPWNALLATAAPVARPLHRRETGREVPWSRPRTGDAFETYEAPVDAPPGRYLWVTLSLSGTGRASPRVRSLRVERPAHDHVDRLPKLFSREPRAASFLQRYLALSDGVLSDLGGRAEARSALLSPAGAPAEALGWLAGFLGLVLDERWPEAVRRRVIDEAPWLMRYRGTLRGLERLLELLTGRDVIVLERWRLRGIGGALLEGRGEAGPAIVGGGLRVGGAVGATESEPVDDDAFATHAHRFTVMVPALLSDEQRAMIEHAIDVHRPAHTLYDLCTLGTGMSVGRGLHVGLHSAIGRTGAWDPLAAGRGVVGSGIVGRRPPGTGIGASGIGRDARVG